MRQCIWDCVLFSDEFDLLQMRFEELEDYVDRFVVVEAGQTFQGAPKPQYFREQLFESTRFDRWRSRITQLAWAGLPGETPWEREASQREILRDFRFPPNDIVLLSDVDELPTGTAIESAVRALRADTAKIVAFDQKFCCFAVDLVHPNTWRGTLATHAHNITSFQKFKEQRDVTPAHVINAGFHFTWLGDKEAHLRKLHSFSHSELVESLQPMLQDGFFRAAGRHVDGTQLTPVTIDESYPAFIRERRCPESWFRSCSAPAASEWASVWPLVEATEGWLTEPEARALYELARTAPHGQGVELGAHKGRSTLALAYGLRAGGRATQHLLSVDNWKEPGIYGEFRDRTESLDNVHPLFTDTTLAARGEKIAQLAPVDFVFIDADHSYEGCRRDFEAWTGHLAPGGLLAFHDAWAPGPSQVIRELPGWYEKHLEADSLSVFRKR